RQQPLQERGSQEPGHTGDQDMGAGECGADAGAVRPRGVSVLYHAVDYSPALRAGAKRRSLGVGTPAAGGEKTPPKTEPPESEDSSSSRCVYTPRPSRRSNRASGFVALFAPRSVGLPSCRHADTPRWRKVTTPSAVVIASTGVSAPGAVRPIV